MERAISRRSLSWRFARLVRRFADFCFGVVARFGAPLAGVGVLAACFVGFLAGVVGIFAGVAGLLALARARSYKYCSRAFSPSGL